MAAISLYGESNMAEVTSCENAREVLPGNNLMGMCRWMGSHFHDWIDYNGIAFSIELQE